jgi:hypothetical protein
MFIHVALRHLGQSRQKLTTVSLDTEHFADSTASLVCYRPPQDNVPSYHILQTKKTPLGAG